MLLPLKLSQSAWLKIKYLEFFLQDHCELKRGMCWIKLEINWPSRFSFKAKSVSALPRWTQYTYHTSTYAESHKRRQYHFFAYYYTYLSIIVASLIPSMNISDTFTYMPFNRNTLLQLTLLQLHANFTFYLSSFFPLLHSLLSYVYTLSFSKGKDIICMKS